jgi:hypothetical protein
MEFKNLSYDFLLLYFLKIPNESKNKVKVIEVNIYVRIHYFLEYSEAAL